MAVTVAMMPSSLLDTDRCSGGTQCFHYQEIKLSSATKVQHQILMKRQLNLPNYTESNTVRKSISLTIVKYDSKGYSHSYLQCSKADVASDSTFSRICATYYLLSEAAEYGDLLSTWR